MNDAIPSVLIEWQWQVKDPDFGWMNAGPRISIKEQVSRALRISCPRLSKCGIPKRLLMVGTVTMLETNL